MVWSLALCPGDTKQDSVVYGAEFGVVYQSLVQPRLRFASFSSTASNRIQVTSPMYSVTLIQYSVSRSKVDRNIDLFPTVRTAHEREIQSLER